MRRRKKRLVKAVDRFITTLLGVIIFCLSVFGVSTICHSAHPEMANVFGYRLIIVDTNSMLPTIKPNAIVLVHSYDKKALSGADVNSIVVFYSNSGVLVTHRIVSLKSHTQAVTMGDANNVPDTSIVPVSNIIYKEVYIMNFTSDVFAQLKSTVQYFEDNPIYIACAALALLIIVMIICIIVCKNKRTGRKIRASKAGTTVFESAAANKLIDSTSEKWQQSMAKITAPPVEAPSVEAPSVEAPPVEAPPVEAPPVGAPPVEAPLVVAPPVVAPPVEAPPVVAPLVVATPVEAPPVVAPPVVVPAELQPGESIDDILAELALLCEEGPASQSNPHGMPR